MTEQAVSPPMAAKCCGQPMTMSVISGH